MRFVRLVRLDGSPLTWRCRLAIAIQDVAGWLANRVDGEAHTWRLPSVAVSVAVDDVAGDTEAVRG